jgi:hypothetical protein
MAKIVFLDNKSQMGGGSGGAWDEKSVGFLGVHLPGTTGYKIYEAMDKAMNVGKSAADSAKGAFDVIAWIKEHWKLLSIGTVALIVLLKN